MTNNYLFIDLETTGLNPADGKILEVHCFFKNEKNNPYGQVMHYPIENLKMDAYVTKMHTENGLLDVLKNGKDLKDIEEELIEYCSGKSNIILAGNSVHFDQMWIKEHMPKFAKLLSHRILDMSTVARFMQDCGLDCANFHDTSHRAKNDIEACYKQYTYYRDIVMDMDYDISLENDGSVEGIINA